MMKPSTVELTRLIVAVHILLSGAVDDAVREMALTARGQMLAAYPDVPRDGERTLKQFLQDLKDGDVLGLDQGLGMMMELRRQVVQEKSSEGFSLMEERYLHTLNTLIESARTHICSAHPMSLEEAIHTAEAAHNVFCLKG